MGTAKQLIPAFVDAEPLEFGDRSYSKNMRPIRGYPNYWRIIDTESIVDGPITQGGQYVDDLYLWQADILTDEDGALTDTIEVVNLGDYLTVISQEEVNGETVYRYKYNSGIESFQYQHTDVIDSVSIEFDQSGRRLVAFESTGNVFLLYFDSVGGSESLLDCGPAYTPHIVTDTYRRQGGSTDSERLLFYVKNSTKQIVYRRQDDRYGVEYTLPSAPSDVVELLKVSKNIYGGLTALYCYDNSGDGLGEGSLTTGSFTARDGADVAHLGTDGDVFSEASLLSSLARLNSLTIEKTILDISGDIDTAELSGNSATLTDFEVKSNERDISSDPTTNDSTELLGSSATLIDFEIKTKEINISSDPTTNDSTELLGSSATLTDFEIVQTLISLSSDTTQADTATLAGSSATLTSFSIA